MDSRDSGLPEMNNNADEPGSRSLSLASPSGIHAPGSIGFNRSRLLGNPRLVLRILALDGDRGRLQILGKTLDGCRLEVTRCRVDSAVDVLTRNKDEFDVVFSNVRLPCPDGSELLSQISVNVGLPVLIISGVEKMTMIISGVARDIHDFLVKPVRDEVLRNILQQMARRRQSGYGEPPVLARNPEEGDRQPRNSSEDSDGASYTSERGSRKRDNSGEDMPPEKKRRLVWSQELHELFIRTVELLGVDKAVPKKILEMMDLPFLTRENVASHLQKYRIFVKKTAEENQKEAAAGSAVSLPGRHDMYGATSSWRMNYTRNWPQQQPAMNIDPWNRPFQAFPNMSTNLQMAPLVQPAELMMPRNPEQLNHPYGVANTYILAGNRPLVMGREEAYNPTLQTPAFPDFPISSRMEFGSQEAALANDFLQIGRQDWELQNPGLESDLFEPQNIILPHQPPEAIVPQQGTALPDMPGNIPFPDDPGTTLPGTFPGLASQSMFPGYSGMQDLLAAPPDQNQQGGGTGMYDRGLGFDGLHDQYPPN